MTEPLAPAVLIDRDELEALRLEADRYRWLRNHSVRIQGSVLWYSGAALDIRVDIGRDHVAVQAKDVTPRKPRARKRLN